MRFERTVTALAAVVVLALAGCASIDFDYPRTESHALEAADTADTYLARSISTRIPASAEGRSGFYPLSNGIDALSSRLLMAARAEQTIDVQYYLIKDDIVGREFVLVLLEAADRGVRVRLLLDDMFTAGFDVGVAALHSHPNFEIRIFNPFKRGAAGRVGSALTGFSRINRRMHNKSFTVDGQVTLIGGRNIADEYFGAREDVAFDDLDVVAIGPIVGEVSSMFDLYWNHETALPVQAFVAELDDPQADLDALREYLLASREQAVQSKYGDAVRDKILDFVERDANMFEWAPYELVYDSPDKGIRKRAAEAASITTPLIKSLRAARQEAIIVSPYFVPLKSGIAGLSELAQRGVDLTVITNSLAANNQFMVHAGYKPSRKPLLESGVRILEVRPDAEVSGTEFVNASGATATLHTKAFIVDRREVFIGSFNFDPRSANINTELGVIIHDEELAEYYATELENNFRSFAYDVFLDDRGRVRWRGFEDGAEVIYQKEPETTWWDRFKVGFVGIFPIKSQL